MSSTYTYGENPAKGNRSQGRHAGQPSSQGPQVYVSQGQHGQQVYVNQGQPGPAPGPAYQAGGTGAGYASAETSKHESETEGGKGSCGASAAREEPQRTGFAMIEPKQEKREKLLKNATEEERAYDEYKAKKAASMRTFGEKKKLGGWGASESQARLQQGKALKQSKYDRMFREEERQRTKKETEKAELQKKKEEARQQARRLESKMQQDSLHKPEEIRRKRLQHLSKPN
eukprot:m.308810 g.308810  ORF g.308810 m.308810 type:complete len:230 (+) comp44882_c0_seq1:50-739(+)